MLRGQGVLHLSFIYLFFLMVQKVILKSEEQD